MRGPGDVGLTHVERYPGSKACFEHAKPETGADESCEVERGGLWSISIHSNDSSYGVGRTESVEHTPHPIAKQPIQMRGGNNFEITVAGTWHRI